MGSNPRLTTYDEDARPWLRSSDDKYGLIVVDTYRQPYIPFYMVTKEFFELARDHLAPGGVVVVNVGHPEGNDEFERVLGRTMAEVFPTVLRDPAEQTNSLLIGGGPGLAARLDRAARTRLHGNLRKLALIDAARMRRGCPAAPSTPTIAPRSSGSSTARSWATPRGSRQSG